MKKAQKQDNGRILGVLYLFQHSTQYNSSHIIASLWNVGMGIELQIFFHCLVSVFFSSKHLCHFLEEIFSGVFMVVYIQIPFVVHLL